MEPSKLLSGCCRVQWNIMENTQDTKLIQISQKLCTHAQIFNYDVLHVGIVCGLLRNIRAFQHPFVFQFFQFFVIVVSDGNVLIIDLGCLFQLRPQISGIHIAWQIGRSTAHPGILINLSTEILAAVCSLFT